jgi:hypothetical protein
LGETPFGGAFESCLLRMRSVFAGRWPLVPRDFCQADKKGSDPFFKAEEKKGSDPSYQL